jgi:hypothetical protein
LLFAWGRERGHVANNPAAGIKGIRRPKGAPEANRPWADNERDAVSAAMPVHMKLPIALMMYCGLDPQDVLRLPRTAVSRDGLMHVAARQVKRCGFPSPRPSWPL